MKDANEITFKQYKVMEYIRNNLGVRFNGTTRLEAQKFISKYIEMSKESSMSHRIERSNDNIKRLERQEFVDWCFGSRNNSFYEPYGFDNDDELRPY